jgi:hypothetical protein
MVLDTIRSALDVAQAPRVDSEYKQKPSSTSQRSVEMWRLAAKRVHHVLSTEIRSGV